MISQRDFERLFEEHAQPLFGFLAYRTGNRAVAEDLVADVFERALRARSRFDRGRGKPRTWLYAIALNCLRDHERRGGAEQRAVERVAAGVPEEEADPAEAVSTRQTIREALEVLSPEERDAIALRYGAELTVPEIATLSGERLTTVEGRVYRALGKLRDELK